MEAIKTEEEFLKVLEENKYFQNFEEQALYNFEAIKFYMDNLSNVVINGTKLTSAHILTPADDRNYLYTNIAFKSLRKRFGFE